jgi:hypothetical protein
MAVASAKTVEKDRISEADSYGRSEMEPGRDAWELLQRVWMTEGRFRIKLPVDPAVISNRLGIKVFDDDELPPEVAGVLRKGAGYEDPKILLNPRDGDQRQRFTCALALGRFSHNIESRREEAWNVVAGRAAISAQPSDPEESFAVDFALELLMPREALREFVHVRSIAALAEIFGVPGDVMSFRMGQIGPGRPCPT